MTKKLNKRGFTIVELVVVIVVIAILAAVLIPTVSSLIDKANRSADEQAVAQMNKALAINEVSSNKTIFDVYDALSDVGITAKDYRPLAKDTYFFWDKALNRIVYTDENNTILFPANLAATPTNGWYSLSGEIKQTKVDVANDGVATVSSASQLYYLSETTPANLTTIKLTDDIDLMGANVSFDVAAGATLRIIADSPITISNLCTVGSAFTETNKENAGKEYACGLIGIARAENNVGTTIELKNITIKDAVIGDLEVGSVGAFVGLAKQSNVTIESCSVENSVINDKNKVGGLIGSLTGAGGIGTKLTVRNCSMKNVSVNCSEGESALFIGCALDFSEVTLDEDYASKFENCSLNLVQGTENRTIKTENIVYKLNGIEEARDVTMVQKANSGSYRMHVESALVTMINATVKIGGNTYTGPDTTVTNEFGCHTLGVFN